MTCLPLCSALYLSICTNILQPASKIDLLSPLLALAPLGRYLPLSSCWIWDAESCWQPSGLRTPPHPCAPEVGWLRRAGMPGVCVSPWHVPCPVPEASGTSEGFVFSLCQNASEASSGSLVRPGNAWALQHGIRHWRNTNQCSPDQCQGRVL